MIPWIPKFREMPARMLDTPTAWDGVESVIAPLLVDFRVKRHMALEFGVQHAYSTVALSNYFYFVQGVDTFVGDPYAGEHADNYEEVNASIRGFGNINLWQCTWREWNPLHSRLVWDLIHVDIFHTYPETFECGKWAIEHSPCVIFHDTLSFSEVARAVQDLASLSGRTFYNLNEKHGLGILSEVTP
jgi:hypothetical protein